MILLRSNGTQVPDQVGFLRISGQPVLVHAGVQPHQETFKEYAAHSRARTSRSGEDEFIPPGGICQGALMTVPQRGAGGRERNVPASGSFLLLGFVPIKDRLHLGNLFLLCFYDSPAQFLDLGSANPVRTGALRRPSRTDGTLRRRSCSDRAFPRAVRTPRRRTCRPCGMPQAQPG